MSTSNGHWTESDVFKAPNLITIARLILSVAVFALIDFNQIPWATAVFILAASTDWIDGYVARKYDMVTVLGRILDPFVDKIIVCGTFIYLVKVSGSGVHAWMVVTIVGREMLVTALRGWLEQQGADFSASQWGKLKMVLQCVAIPLCLLCALFISLEQLPPAWLHWTRVAVLWSAIASTVISGLIYIREAVRLTGAAQEK
ncbi:MAG: CDP-diacylglycerol--glycerol-3-phosphate 3-phosphatidyltransferase [Planctomycetales bacterium]